jgi:hypothetical protein
VNADEACAYLPQIVAMAIQIFNGPILSFELRKTHPYAIRPLSPVAPIDLKLSKPDSSLKVAMPT